MKTMTGTTRLGRPLAIIAMFLALLPLAAGAAERPSAERPSIDPDNVKYVRELSKANRRGFAFDFSDDRQYRYVISRFEMMGKDTRNSPELFRRLGEARRLHIIRKSDPMSIRAVNEFEDGSGHAIVELRPDDDGINVNAAAMGNVPGGTPYAYIDTFIWEGVYPVAGNYSEEFGNGSFFEVETAGATTVIECPQADSMACKEHPVTGVITCTFVSASTCGKRFVFLNIEQPADRPDDVESPDEYRVCLARGNNWDCDIDLTGSAGDIKMPLKGSIAYKCPISPLVDVDPADGLPDNAKAVVNLTMADAGVMCGTQQLDLPEEDFWNDPETVISQGNRQLSWDLSEPGSEATFDERCRIVQEFVRLCMSIKVTVFCPFIREEEEVELHFCSRRDPGDPIDLPDIMDPIRFQNSCVAEGTLIRLPDGRAEPVEELVRGTSALTHQGGSALTIVAITKGNESAPMVKLRDDRGHQLLVTEGHPVITPRGPVLAGDLHRGDTVFTEVGPAALVSVTREPYGGKVYNLILGTEIERASLSSRDDSTMIANGFVSGDERMQTYYNYESLKRPPVTLADVAPNWRQDYLNSQRRGAVQETAE